ncbi:putative 2-oxoglutarate dehydrogenase E1 component DHKTD1, mitochondrial [Lobulomyces angularis]|nr:putative 2-oxoglutarate dehydrogenase E1 component DHKTD1, mitochondrial [Lobulomyces angularis]
MNLLRNYSKLCIRKLPLRSIQKRSYFYDNDVFGYRIPKEWALEPYTQEQLDNRNANANLLRLVKAYRTKGHLQADLDPLGLAKKEEIPELDPKYYGLNDPNQVFDLNGIAHISKTKRDTDPLEEATLEKILKQLNRTYSGRLGFEFEHIPNTSERRWIAQQLESQERKTLKKEEKMDIFNLLTKSEVFDHFMAKKFPAVKRYGLEGAESMMVALDSLFKNSNIGNIDEVVVCMPHRGRMNLLTGSMNFSPTQLFHKVKGNSELPVGTPGIGDVISHLAKSVDLDFKHGKSIHVSLLHNPSHLEAANPVAMGKTRAKQLDLLKKGTAGSGCSLGDRILCVQLHGDSAFTGQGVVTETLGLSNLPHYCCGGSIHLIVNNQVGYTTTPMNGRSTVYSSDIAKMINAPVIHVNADHPEDVTYAMELAFGYRQHFKKDIIVDLIGFRRWGHNELDEPAFTQPLMYKIIRNRKSVPTLYEEKLLNEGVVSKEDIVKVRDAYFEELTNHLEASYTFKPTVDFCQGKWKDMIIPTHVDNSVSTGVDINILKEVGKKSVQTPESFTPHPRLKKYHIETRIARAEEGTKLDWATCEAMMFGSLMKEGYDVRISGQDVGRGTFSQRHVMLIDQDTEKTYIPLNQMSPDQKAFLEIANSHLSEFAVLGFEVGVSWENPNRLCIWEAQFGDFFNGAQIIIDTYLSSSESKWLRQTGLVMLLPHGMDGAGPEHSGCRMERFLQLCDQKFDVLNTEKIDNPNMHVVNPTTPAQYFHVMRRQMTRNYRKPLIVVGPKTLLRHPQATSSIEDMGPNTYFQPVLGDTICEANPSSVERVIFMSGKLYYDLIKKRNDMNLNERVAIIRLEELCPFPVDALIDEVNKYTNATDFVYVQEEQQNQGAYSYVLPRLNQLLPEGMELRYVGREALCAPAVGVSSVHKKEQAWVIDTAFA